MTYLDEAQIEIIIVDYFRELGYGDVHGPDIAPDGQWSGVGAVKSSGEAA